MMNDIVNLGKYTIYMKLMIDGISSRGFSAGTLLPFSKLEKSNREAIIAHSREKYSTPREEVQKSIAEWSVAIPSQERESASRDDRFRRAQSDRPRREEKPRRGREDFDSRRTQSGPRDDSRPRPVSLGEAFGQGAVGFKGRKPKLQQKKEVNTEELRKILEESLKK